MTKLKKELGTNLIVVKCPCGAGKGHLVLLQDLATFTIQNVGPYVPPAAPPPVYLNIPAVSESHEIECRRSKNNNDQCHYQTYKHVILIGVNQIYEDIKPVYYAKLESSNEGLSIINIRIFINHIIYHYCKIGQYGIDNNANRFNQCINPSLPLAAYCQKKEVCQGLIVDVAVPISNQTMGTTGTKHALQSSNIQQAWREWLRRPVEQKNWNNWKNHCNAAFIEQREIQKFIRSIKIGHANNVTENKNGEQMVASLNNLTNVAIQRNNTVLKTGNCQQESHQYLFKPPSVQRKTLLSHSGTFHLPTSYPKWPST